MRWTSNLQIGLIAAIVSGCSPSEREGGEVARRDPLGYPYFVTLGPFLGKVCAIEATISADLNFTQLEPPVGGAPPHERFGPADHGYGTFCGWKDFEARRAAFTVYRDAGTCGQNLSPILIDPAPSSVLLDSEQVADACERPVSLIDHYRLRPPAYQLPKNLSQFRQVCFRAAPPAEKFGQQVDWADQAIRSARQSFLLPVEYVRRDGELVDVWIDESVSPWAESVEDLLIRLSRHRMGMNESYSRYVRLADGPATLSLRDCAEAIPIRERVR